MKKIKDKLLIGLLGISGMLCAQAPSGAHAELVLPAKGKMSVFGQHDFTDFNGQNSIVYTDRSTVDSYFAFAGESRWSRATSYGYVDGKIRNITKTDFVYPVGHDGEYRPMATLGAKDVIVDFTYSDPNEISAKANLNEIVRLSDTEYWSVSGSGEAQVTLTWEIKSHLADMVDELDELTIAAFDGESWVAIPATVDISMLDTDISVPVYSGARSTVSQGSITSDQPVDLAIYSYFAIAKAADVVKKGKPSFAIFPNPAVENNYVYVDFEFSSQKGGNIKVLGFDEIPKHSINVSRESGKVKMDTDELTQGVYWVVLTDANGQEVHKKMIIVDHDTMR